MSHKDIHFSKLLTTVTELRSENGCPWDIRQTPKTLIKYLNSEVEELVEAIESEKSEDICEELGDVLFLVVMIAQICNEAGNFTIGDVIEGVNEKLIRRHPHVFAGLKISDEQELRELWQRIKAEEKSKN